MALDPSIIVAIISTSGGVVEKLIEIAGSKASPGNKARKAIKKNYDSLASELSTNSVRVLLVLKEYRGHMYQPLIQQRISELAIRQEPKGKAVEYDITYRMKLLAVIGLVQEGSAQEYALTKLGLAFLEEAEKDEERFRRAFEICK